ncbi:MAG: hypothetical protein ABEH65_07620 [Halobacteriales archaeon]
MSITGHQQNAATDPPAVAHTLREAPFANLLARADGASLAATALLIQACEAIGLPYQVSPIRTRAAAADRRAGMADATAVIAVGMDTTDPADGNGDGVDADAHLAGQPVTAALEVADQLEASVSPTLALAGIVAAGEVLSAYPSLIDRAGLERRPGIAIPTADPIDGLAHTTLTHGPFSGDPERTAETIAGIDGETMTEADHRQLASLTAVAVTGAADATPRAATAVEAVLRPYPIDGPVATLGGYADVLEATAATAPGVGIALALDGDVRSAALDHWRDHARRVHVGVRSASTARYDGLLVARLDDEGDDTTPVEAVARLLRDFRAPEPAVLAIAGDRAGLATTETPAAAVLPAATAAVGGSALTRGDRGFATIDPDQTEGFITALRGGL